MTPSAPRVAFLLCLLSCPAFASAPAEQAAGQQTAEPAPVVSGEEENPEPLTRAEEWRRHAEAPLTRAEEWRRRRFEKLTRLQPYRPGFIERNLLAIEKAERPSLLQVNFWGFYPRFESIASGSQQTAGLRFWQPEIKGSPWDVHGSIFYSIAGYEYYDLQVGMLPNTGRQFPLRSTKEDDVYELGDPRRQLSHLIAYASLRYRHYPQEDFFGLGEGSSRQDHSTFLFQDASYELVTGVQMTPHLAATLRTGYVQASLGPGEEEPFPTTQAMFDDAAAPGLLEQPDFLRFTGQLFVDYRDLPGNPHRGAMAALQVSRVDDRGGNAFRFTRYSADLRGFLPLGSPQRVLAVRAFANLDDPDRGSRVPFYMQETLGGSHTLRGFRNFRFRGEKLLLLQAEYRWEAAPAVELALFAETGKVAVVGQSFDLKDAEADYGIGIRVKTFDDVLVRFDVARSREDTRLLFRFSPSF
jgi:hypothetical protein